MGEVDWADIVLMLFEVFTICAASAMWGVGIFFFDTHFTDADPVASLFVACLMSAGASGWLFLDVSERIGNDG